MKTETTTLADLAGEAFDGFERIKRGEDTIYTLKDGRPDWVRELAYTAHGDFMPDDWRYESIVSALAAIHDGGDGYDIDDLGAEWADNNVDIYNNARTAWLASNLNRAGYCDEAREEGLTSSDCGVFDLIGVGQYFESREIFSLVQSALEDRLEEVSA